MAGAPAQRSRAVIAAIHAQRLRELARAGAEGVQGIDQRAAGAGQAALLHLAHAAGGFESADEDKAVDLALDQDIQQPVDAVIHVDVGGAGRIVRDEFAGAGPVESMARFVALFRVRFDLHDEAARAVPDQLAPDQLARAGQRVPLKKCASQIAGGAGVFRGGGQGAGTGSAASRLMRRRGRV